MWFRNLLSSFWRRSASRTESLSEAAGVGPKRCYEILLPLTSNDRRPIPDEAFELTQSQLLARFGALSTFPQVVKGIWLHDGVRYEDDLMRLSVDVTDASRNRALFVGYKQSLLERFDQIVIYIRSYSVDII